MRNRPLWIAVALFGASWLVTMCAPNKGVPPTSTPSVANCQKTLDDMAALTRGLELPEYLMQEDAVCTGEEFDVNRYFSVLTHLSMPAGTVLDYVYYFDGMGGQPVLYARKADETPFRIMSDYEAAVDAGKLPEGPDAYVQAVQADGTEQGFFELAVLRVMGRQFYLWWHAGYNDAAVVCDPAGLESILSAHEADAFGMPMSAEVVRKARALDLAPTVELQGDVAIVRLVFFTNWGGFYRLSLTIDRGFPHAMTENAENLVEYDCEIWF